MVAAKVAALILAAMEVVAVEDHSQVSGTVDDCLVLYTLGPGPGAAGHHAIYLYHQTN